MGTLPPGTIIDFEGFSTLVVGDDLLLVFQSDSYFAQEGNLLKLDSRGSNDWAIRLYDDDRWERSDYLVSRDWNGNFKCKSFDEYDWYGSWYDDDDDLYDFRQDEYDHIYDDNGW